MQKYVKKIEYDFFITLDNYFIFIQFYLYLRIRKLNSNVLMNYYIILNIALKMLILFYFRLLVI